MGLMAALSPHGGYSAILLLSWVLLSLKFLMSSSHVMILLLVLEFFMLLLVSLLIYSNMFSSFTAMGVLLFFTFAVIEASLGLGVLINLSRASSSLSPTTIYSFKL